MCRRPPEVGECVEGLEPLQHARSCGRILEGAGVVVCVALILQVTRKARRPERLVRHALDKSLKNGMSRTIWIRNDAAHIQIDDCDTCFWGAGSKAAPYKLCEAWELFGARGEEIDEAAFVDRDQACVVVGPCGYVRAFERGKERVQDGLVRLITLVLAAIVVAQKAAATQRESTTIWQGIVHNCVFVAGSCCKLLQKTRSSHHRRCL